MHFKKVVILIHIHIYIIHRGERKYQTYLQPSKPPQPFLVHTFLSPSHRASHPRNQDQSSGNLGTPLPLRILLLHALLIKPVRLLLTQPLALRARRRGEAAARKAGGRCVAGVAAAAGGCAGGAGLLGELRGVWVHFALQLVGGLFCEEGDGHFCCLLVFVGGLKICFSLMYSGILSVEYCGCVIRVC
ncbi:hypothetical protein BDW74DRAFT_1638 [Aspergillus multicolor]|uniref:uncharacterized protein n=1 Tax=Aspergillus multicolor TaxID=41759 RepID=UPI003CCE14F0